MRLLKFHLYFGICVLFALSANAAGRKVIIDTDPGTDDAMAILLALNSPELDVRAITVVAGNVTVDRGVENALRLVSLSNRCDIPVAKGAERPLAQKLVTAEFFHGKNGMGDVELPASACRADSRYGPDLIIELVHHYPHELTLVPIGPLTNIAQAISKDPSIVPLVKELILMCGSISGGNATAAAESNIFNDPEAARAVFGAGWPITMVGLNVTEQTLFTRRQLEQFQNSRRRESQFAAAILRFMVGLAEKLGAPGTQMYDPLAVGAAIDPTLLRTAGMRVDIETRGEFTRGETVASRFNSSDHRVLHGDRYVVEGIERVQPNVHVAVGVDADRFLNLFIGRLTGK